MSYKSKCQLRTIAGPLALTPAKSLFWVLVGASLLCERSCWTGSISGRHDHDLKVFAFRLQKLALAVSSKSGADGTSDGSPDSPHMLSPAKDESESSAKEENEGDTSKTVSAAGSEGHTNNSNCCDGSSGKGNTDSAKGNSANGGSADGNNVNAANSNSDFVSVTLSATSQSSNFGSSTADLLENSGEEEKKTLENVLEGISVENVDNGSQAGEISFGDSRFGLQEQPPIVSSKLDTKMDHLSLAKQPRMVRGKHRWGGARASRRSEPFWFRSRRQTRGGEQGWNRG